MTVKRFISVGLAILLIITSFTNVIYASQDENSKISSEKISISADVEVSSASLMQYSNYITTVEGMVSATKEIKTLVNADVVNSPVTVEIDVPKTALYTFGMEYLAKDYQTANFEIGLQVDNRIFYEEMSKFAFRRYWTESKEYRVDGQGNEFSPESSTYVEYVTDFAADIKGWSDDYYLLPLTAGRHIFTITPKQGEFNLKSIILGSSLEETEAYKSPVSKEQYYNGENVVIEGESYSLKNSYWVSVKSDDSSSYVTPSSPYVSKINYAGENWSSTGDTLTWKTPELEAGYYQISFNFRQSMLVGNSSYRRLEIDGETPFKEAKSIGFSYSTGWQQETFVDDKETPYLIYLDKGTHEISLTVTMGEMEEVCVKLNEITSNLGNLYTDITMITGETVDVYRDYDLFKQVPDMQERLKKALADLEEIKEKLITINGKGGSYLSVVNGMAQVLDKMLDSPSVAHRYKSNYYSSYCSLSQTLNDMRSMPLHIDRIILSKPNQEVERTSNFFKQLGFAVKRFFISFVMDYNNVSGVSESDDNIKIWVNWGRDQAQVLNSMIQSSFTEKEGIGVDVQVVNATIVQGTLSGNGPDVILQHSRVEPVNLAMRGILYDLTQFEDCDEVLKRFQPNAATPYYYKNGLYALPDTQLFYMMFYRKDILEKLGISVPKTWDEFANVVKLLSRDNLDVWLPFVQITDMNQTNSGIGSLSIFPSMLIQNNLSLYTADGRATTLTTPETISVFSKWTDYYTKLKVPVTLSFYNRFRIGTCPLGIEAYTIYNTLKFAAPEIDGAWGIAPVPGTVQKDGTINRSTSGGGTSCAILKSCKNPEAAWKFLKWWTDAETQATYSNNVESILGPVGRIAVSNVEALQKLSWDPEDEKQILTAWGNVKEIPEYPGSYYISRSIDHSFWNVVNSNETPKSMLLQWGKEVDEEIENKWKQYENRGK